VVGELVVDAASGFPKSIVYRLERFLGPGHDMPVIQETITNLWFPQPGR
jgi:hypothetical protein